MASSSGILHRGMACNARLGMMLGDTIGKRGSQLDRGILALHRLIRLLSCFRAVVVGLISQCQNGNSTLGNINDAVMSELTGVVQPYEWRAWMKGTGCGFD